MQDYLRFKEISELFSAGEPEKARHLLMEMQSRCIGLRDEIRMLTIRLRSLEDTLRSAQNLFMENGFYWLRINGFMHGPFCPSCHKRDGSLVRLEKKLASRICPYCQEVFQLEKGEKLGADIPHHARILHFAR